MRTIILAAALLGSTAAFAQTTDSTTTTTTTTTDPAASSTMDTGASAPAATSTDMSAPAPAATSTDMSATTTTASAAPGAEMGPTTKVLAKGQHYAVHRVMADGTVMVKVLTGDDAEMAMAGKQPAALAAFMSQQPLTAGAGTPTPQ